MLEHSGSPDPSSTQGALSTLAVCDAPPRLLARTERPSGGGVPLQGRGLSPRPRSLAWCPLSGAALKRRAGNGARVPLRGRGSQGKSGSEVQQDSGQRSEVRGQGSVGRRQEAAARGLSSHVHRSPFHVQRGSIPRSYGRTLQSGSFCGSRPPPMPCRPLFEAATRATA